MQLQCKSRERPSDCLRNEANKERTADQGAKSSGTRDSIIRNGETRKNARTPQRRVCLWARSFGLFGRVPARFSSHCFNERWLSPDDLPRSRLSTLISSSSSGQCIPSPLPISRQLLRSSRLPWRSRGYPSKGAEIVRPSVRSTTRVSFVTFTRCAMIGVISITLKYNTSPSCRPSSAERLPPPGRRGRGGWFLRSRRGRGRGNRGWRCASSW